MWKKVWKFLLAGGAMLLPLASLGSTGSNASPAKNSFMIVDRPPNGKLYHGIYPGTADGQEDAINMADVTTYESLSGTRVAWVYFSDNWYHGRAFPRTTAEAIREHGATPYIRLMLRSSADIYEQEPVYTLQNIIDGKFDDDLAAWGRDAQQFASPLIVEYGTECNGDWFSWNGVWNGGDRLDGFGDPGKPDGPQRFVAAYRHIVAVLRKAGAANITWVFHVSSYDEPDNAWNALEHYYPGDDVVDWLAVSVYGAVMPLDEAPDNFTDQMDDVYQRLTALAPNKPIVVAEFGCTANHPVIQPAEWSRAALENLLADRWPKVIGFSWWNEHWQNDDDPAHDSSMRLQDNPLLADTFRELLPLNLNRLQTSVQTRVQSEE